MNTPSENTLDAQIPTLKHGPVVFATQSLKFREVYTLWYPLKSVNILFYAEAQQNKM